MSCSEQAARRRQSTLSSKAPSRLPKAARGRVRPLNLAAAAGGPGVLLGHRPSPRTVTPHTAPRSRRGADGEEASAAFPKNLPLLVSSAAAIFTRTMSIVFEEVGLEVRPLGHVFQILNSAVAISPLLSLCPCPLEKLDLVRSRFETRARLPRVPSSVVSLPPHLQTRELSCSPSRHHVCSTGEVGRPAAPAGLLTLYSMPRPFPRFSTIDSTSYSSSESSESSCWVEARLDRCTASELR